MIRIPIVVHRVKVFPHEIMNKFLKRLTITDDLIILIIILIIYVIMHLQFIR